MGQPMETTHRITWVTWLATGFGFGFSPFAPGTVGTLWGIPLAWGIAQIPSPIARVALIVGLILIGVPMCTRAARELGKKDPGAVVWDEIASLPLTFAFLPDELLSRPWVLLTGFALHRLFDISKIPPARQLEKLPEGIGIMADDLAAAAYACIALHLIVKFTGLGG